MKYTTNLPVHSPDMKYTTNLPVHSLPGGYTTSLPNHPMPGACGPDGRCLSCGMQGDTAGCPNCKVSVTRNCEISVTPFTVTLPQTITIPILGLQHGCDVCIPCPHCMGLGSFFP
jgi:hypothetical protein